jgi:FKBP-type peptidyl-prolyl cis-trans isomerase FkpA
MMKRYFLLLIVVSITSCNLFKGPKSPYKDFFTRDGITHYRYCDMGSVPRKLKKGDMAELVLCYAKMNDSVFWSSADKGYPNSLFFTYSKLVSGSTYEKEVLHANLGDSVIYIVPTDSVFKNILHLPIPHFLDKNGMMTVHLRIKDIYDSSAYNKRLKEIAVYKNNMDIQEQVILSRYVSANNIPDTDKHDNVYIIPEDYGTGPAIKRGDMVSLSYKGAFLSGKMFDSVGFNTPLQFRFGDTAQMITGLEIAIKMMRQGEKAKIIIPSQLAFGNNGSSTGIVPPYTTVIYEVTLLKVQAL